MDWLVKNMEWLFSGIGVTVLGWLISRQYRPKIDQSVKKSSNVTQVGGNVRIGAPNDRAKR